MGCCPPPGEAQDSQAGPDTGSRITAGVTPALMGSGEGAGKAAPHSALAAAHWKERLLLGSPPDHWPMNLSTSWHTGLWDVCKREEKVLGTGCAEPPGLAGFSASSHSLLGVNASPAPEHVHDQAAAGPSPPTSHASCPQRVCVGGIATLGQPGDCPLDWGRVGHGPGPWGPLGVGMGQSLGKGGAQQDNAHGGCVTLGDVHLGVGLGQAETPYGG